MALNHTNYGSERHDSWFGVEALTRTTRGSPESEYSHLGACPARKSADAKLVPARAIEEHGAQLEMLSHNSPAVNQLRQGGIGSVEIFLASRGTMPIQ